MTYSSISIGIYFTLLMVMEEINILIKARPFLKWAGGKRALINDLKKHVPNEFNKYYEPFCGSAALFFSLLPKSAVLSDSNKDLINCYKQIKKSPDEIINILKTLKYDKKIFYQIRAEKTKDAQHSAARFIYLNHSCWNGLWRVNKNGEFNVPFGRYKKSHKIYNEEVLKNASMALKKVKLRTGDFILRTYDIKPKDFIYFDPPYTVKHGNNGFLSYNENIFSWKDQERLANYSRTLADKGVKVMISNANAKEIKELYRDFNIYHVNRTSVISGSMEGRGKVKELIITSY